jgi:hypothetical protein
MKMFLAFWFEMLYHGWFIGFVHLGYSGRPSVVDMCLLQFWDWDHSDISKDSCKKPHWS